MSQVTMSNGNSTSANGSVVDVVIDCSIKNLYYGKFRAVRDSHIPIDKGRITAFIGPSGCGKSTALRCLNRMNDLVRGFRFEGHVHFRGKDIYHKKRSIRWQFAATSAWYFSSPIRSR